MNASEHPSAAEVTPLIPPELAPFVRDYLHGSLSARDEAEVIRIAAGLPCAASGRLAGISAETARARRKRIYRALAVDGARELQSTMLGVALRELARAS